MKREAGAGGAGSLALCQEREGPYVPQWRSYHTRTFARRMWRCIYSANYATRARPKLLRHTHHVESRDANVHVSPPLAQDLVQSRHGDLHVFTFRLSDFIYICAQMQISPQAAGVSPTVCVLLHYPRHTDKQIREHPPLDSLSKSLCVDLEPRNLNSK